jgi:hypothetical protein
MLCAHCFDSDLFVSNEFPMDFFAFHLRNDSFFVEHIPRFLFCEHFVTTNQYHKTINGSTKHVFFYSPNYVFKYQWSNNPQIIKSLFLSRDAVPIYTEGMRLRAINYVCIYAWPDIS